MDEIISWGSSCPETDQCSGTHHTRTWKHFMVGVTVRTLTHGSKGLKLETSSPLSHSSFSSKNRRKVELRHRWCAFGCILLGIILSRLVREVLPSDVIFSRLVREILPTGHIDKASQGDLAYWAYCQG